MGRLAALTCGPCSHYVLASPDYGFSRVRFCRRAGEVFFMTITSADGAAELGPELVSRFARETEPLVDVLARGARRLTRCDADAEDLLQDTLLYAFTGFHTFAQGTNLKAWLFRILYNRWVSTHRSKQRRPAEVAVDTITDTELAEGLSRLQARTRSAEAEVLDSLPDTDIRAAMRALPGGFAAAVYYADVEGYTYAETAALLNIPVGTVMSRVSRGRKRLRFALAHLASGRGERSAEQRSIA